MANYYDWVPEQFGTKTESYGEGYSREVPGVTYYKDPTTGNYYDVPFGQRGYWASPDEPLPLDFENAKLVATAEALNDPYIKSLGYQNDPAKAQALYQQKLNEPKAFYSDIAKSLENDIFGNWSNSWEYEGLKDVKQQFNELKDVAPDVYYENLLTNKAKQIGWNYGQNGPENAKIYEEQLRNEIPNALKAGLSQEQINNIVSSKINEGAQLGQTIAANAASGGNFWNQNLLGALKIGAFALGAGGLDAALAGAASSGAGGTGLTTGTGGANGLLNTSAGGAFSPAGAMATQSAAGLGGAGTGIIEGLIPSSIGMAGTAGAGSLAGITGTQLAAGLGGANLGYGLTADQLAQYEAGGNAAKGMTLSDALKYANQARQGLGVASTIAKLAGGQGTTGQTGGFNTQQLASALRPTNTFNPINLAQIQPKNPFTFNTQGQTQASEGMYDVSGMANALRNR